MLSYHALATPTDCSISPPVSPRLPAVARDTIGAACENVEYGCGQSLVCQRSHVRVNKKIKNEKTATMKDTILCSLKPYKLCGFKVG